MTEKTYDEMQNAESANSGQVQDQVQAPVQSGAQGGIQGGNEAQGVQGTQGEAVPAGQNLLGNLSADEITNLVTQLNEVQQKNLEQKRIQESDAIKLKEVKDRLDAIGNPVPLEDVLGEAERFLDESYNLPHEAKWNFADKVLSSIEQNSRLHKERTEREEAERTVVLREKFGETYYTKIEPQIEEKLQELGLGIKVADLKVLKSPSEWNSFVQGFIDKNDIFKMTRLEQKSDNVIPMEKRGKILYGQK